MMSANLLDSQAMVRVLAHLNPEALAGIAAGFPDVEFTAIEREGELDPSVQGEVLLTTAIGAPTLEQALDRGVKWVHTVGTGVDRFPLHLIRPGQTLTCSRGASALGIAEWTMTMMLTYVKRIPDSFVKEPPERWFQSNLGGLYGATLGIVGMGSIGERVAQLSLPFGMKVKGYRRSLRPADTKGVEVVGSLAEALADADHVMIAAPLTPETHHLINADAFKLMKPGVHIVNIARGGLIDQDALRDALDRGIVAHASLDTVDPEPLPAGHWLYGHRNVRVSPHISWVMPSMYETLYDTFRENLTRFCAGRPLDYVVNVALGY